MNFYSHIEEIEEKIGYTFKDKSLLCQAFTRTSFCNENRGKNGERLQSNEVLEFFGDSVLSTAIVSLLMKDYAERYPYGIKTDFDEGDFSNIKSKLSDKKMLSSATRVMGLETFLRMGEGDKNLGIEKEPSVMEDLFESIIGAIFVDSEGNLTAVIGALKKMLDVSQYLKKTKAPSQSAKNSLQEWCAKKSVGLPPPVYKTIKEEGPDHKKTYTRGCYIGEVLYGVGVGKSFKLADAEAAELALEALKKKKH